MQKNAREEPHSARLKDWTLSDLSILQWVTRQGLQYNWEAMRSLATIIPSIKSFAGQGHIGQEGLSDLEPKYDIFDVVGLGKRSEAWT